MSDNGVKAGFAQRHIGTTDPNELKQMLGIIKADSLDQLINETDPDPIRLRRKLNIPEAIRCEQEYLRHIQQIAAMNKVFKSYIGLGYYRAHTPSVIRRNIFRKSGMVYAIHALPG